MKYPRSHRVFEIAYAPAQRGVIDPSAPRRSQKAALLGNYKRIIEGREVNEFRIYARRLGSHKIVDV